MFDDVRRISNDVKFVVRLTSQVQERVELPEMVDEGERAKTVQLRGWPLLQMVQSEERPGRADARAVECAEASLPSFHRVRKRLVTEGFEAAMFLADCGALR